MTRPAALAGLRVVELGQLVAGPFAAGLLAYFGAEVVKLEPPGGDPLRRWRALDDDGTSVWWRTLGRNKRSLVVDLARPEGAALARRLCLAADVVVENFRPGTLERWGLDPEELRRERPELIVARVSGYGQTGPWAARPGFAAVCEAHAGLRHLTGYPGELPVRANLSLGDSLAGLFAALGVLLALVERGRSARGQVVDVAITEAVMSMLESTLAEQARLGVIRPPSGTTITGVAPTGAYRCADGVHLVIGGNSEPVFARLCRAIGRAELAADPRFVDNAARVANAATLEQAIGGYCAAQPAAAVLAALEAAEVPCARIHDAAELAAHPQTVARGWLERVPLGDGEIELPGLAPRLSETPGRSAWAGPELGAGGGAMLRAWLGASEDDLVGWRASGALGHV